MIRQIIKIDEDLCNGCELCVNACHEGAIQMKNGKAVLVRDDYCDGLGNCLPVCPTGAITFEQREALAFDEKAVEVNMNKLNSSHDFESQNENDSVHCGCPSSLTKTIKHKTHNTSVQSINTSNDNISETSNLMQWPIQIQLVPSHAGFLNDSHLLIAADCTAYAHPSFNRTFMKNKITIIGCPKLDDSAYKEKFTEIFIRNNIKSVTVIRMEVPCCSGLVYSAVEALRDSGKMIPWNVITLATDGSVIEE